MKRMLRTLQSLGMLWLTFMSYAEVYRWVDPDGVVHFADEPVAGAKPVQKQPITTFPQKTFSDNNANNSEAVSKASYYQSIRIHAPTPQSTIWDVNGRVAVIIECLPALRKNDRLLLLLDNQAVGTPTKNRLLALAGVERGAHTLRAMIVNGQHKTIQSSKSVVFYLQKPRIVKPVVVDGALRKQPK